ncbi:hypothetical protein ACLMJK_001784 [Lecanora helva]
MDERFEDGNAFAVPNFGETSSLRNLDQPSTAETILFNDLQLDDVPDLDFEKENDLYLPELSTPNNVHIDDAVTLDILSNSPVVEPIESIPTLPDDVWFFPSSTEMKQTFPSSRSWETFNDKHVLTAALEAGDEDSATGFLNSAGVETHSKALLANLLQLGLGRESALYCHSEDVQSFVPLIEEDQVPGYNPEAFRNLSSSMIDCGNKTRSLLKFIHSTQSSVTSPQSLTVLAAIFTDTLATIHKNLDARSKSLCSILQLRLLFERPHIIISCLINITREVANVRTDEEVISRLYKMVEDSESRAPWLRRLMLRILALVSKPWLESVSKWLGVGTHSGLQRHDQLPSFVKRGVTRDGDSKINVEDFDYKFEPQLLPSFIAEEDAQIMFDTGQSLRLLETYQPEHPLLGQRSRSVAQLTSLDWQFSWGDVERVQAKARTYEFILEQTISDFNLSGKKRSPLQAFDQSPERNHNHDPVACSAEIAKEYISASVSAFERPLPQPGCGIPDTSSSVHCLLEGGNDSDGGTAPPISLLPGISFGPVISVQAHLTNRACLRLLFKECRLRSHLSLLRHYHLFGDGVFTSRLSHALFDPGLQTAEHRKEHFAAGTSGLRLGSRDTWPPASSEVRLALMDILTDNYHQNNQFPELLSSFRNALPGGLSFAIRELSEDESQRCMNPDSIEALDFLKLEYRPPPPVDTVITSSILLKYDAIFNLLLRATRMIFALNKMFLDCKIRFADTPKLRSFIQLFRIQSHHFVVATCTHFSANLQANWNHFEEKLDRIEKGLDQNSNEGLSHLRDHHEHALDQMMSALMLRKQDAQLMGLLEDIFTLVLLFARHMGFQNAIPVEESHLRDLHEKFQEKVRTFVAACRELNERQKQRDAKSGTQSNNDSIEEGEDNALDRLLLKLDFERFYQTS